jgi:hypothetical protein
VIERRAVRLAGLEWVLDGLPDSTMLPTPWEPFELRGQTSSAAAIFTYFSESCPIIPSGQPINSGLYFHLFRTPDHAGFLGFPVPEPGWRAIYWPNRRRLDFYVAGQPDSARIGVFVDQVFWRFHAFFMAPADRLVLHATAAMKNGRVLVLPGDTGRGKSTLAGLLHKAGWTILSDESPIVEAPAQGPFRVWGSPWPSSMGFASPECGILAGIYFLEHGSENRITPLEPGAAVKRLIVERLFICPWYEDRTRDLILAAIDRMLLRIPSAALAFKPDADVVALLEKEW